MALKIESDRFLKGYRGGVCVGRGWGGGQDGRVVGREGYGRGSIV